MSDETAAYPPNWRNTYKYGAEHAAHADVDRFTSKVAPASLDECWLWTGTKDTDGYGVLKIAKRMHKAHRLAFQFAFGWLPQRGRFICHKCDTPACVNPRHLYAGLPCDNSFDMVSRGRSARGERDAASRLTEADVRLIRQRLAAGAAKRALAREFRVSDTAIRYIGAYRTWRHVGMGAL